MKYMVFHDTMVIWCIYIYIICNLLTKLNHCCFSLASISSAFGLDGPWMMQ